MTGNLLEPRADDLGPLSAAKHPPLRNSIGRSDTPREVTRGEPQLGNPLHHERLYLGSLSLNVPDSSSGYMAFCHTA